MIDNEYNFRICEYEGVDMSSRYTYTNVRIGEQIATGLSDDIRTEIDLRMMFIIKLNTLPEELVIEEIIKDPEAIYLINTTTDAMKEAHKFAHEL